MRLARRLFSHHLPQSGMIYCAYSSIAFYRGCSDSAERTALSGMIPSLHPALRVAAASYSTLDRSAADDTLQEPLNRRTRVAGKRLSRSIGAVRCPTRTIGLMPDGSTLTR